MDLKRKSKPEKSSKVHHTLNKQSLISFDRLKSLKQTLMDQVSDYSKHFLAVTKKKLLLQNLLNTPRNT